MAGYIFEQGQRCACLIDPRGVRRAMRKAGARLRGAASRLPVGRRRSSLGALPGRSGKPDTRPKGSAVAASSPDKGGILQGFVKTALAALYKVEIVISCTGIVTLALVSHFWPLPEPAKSLETLQRHQAKRSEFGGELCQRDNAGETTRVTRRSTRLSQSPYELTSGTFAPHVRALNT